jgi:hypothetical protein
MFRIRNEQLDAIGMKRFIDRVEQTLMDEWFMRRTFDEEKTRLPLRKMLEHGIGVAQGYGLETEQDLVLFVLNMIDVNPEFHKHPPMQRLVSDKSLVFEQRKHELLSLSDAEWEAAARIGDAHAYWSRVVPEYWKEVERGE